MPVLLFTSQVESPPPWKRALEAAMPGLEVRVWPDAGAPRSIDYVLCWKPPAEVFRGLERLKAVFSLGAGIDHLKELPGLPAGVPVVRMVEPALTEGMTEYVLYQVLRFHRHMPEYEAQRARREWRELPQTRPGDRRIGIMGLGHLGADAAVRLRDLGFDVAGWSRRPKDIAGVESYTGRDRLDAFLERTDILICMLPLTDETKAILDRNALARLPAGAFVINVGRGPHVVEADLIDALESGQVAGAALDVFQTEPLPPEHPFWDHPKITMTPHVASLTNPVTAARIIADNIARCESGEAPDNVVDFSRGY